MAVSEQQSSVFEPWSPEMHLEQVSQVSVDLSKGFLRSRPQEWFPGFAFQWAPFFHSLAIDAKLVEVAPKISLPEVKSQWQYFQVNFDGEPLFVAIDPNSAAIISNSVVPGADKSTKDISLEYVVRRLMGSLSLSWSAGKSDLQFAGKLESAPTDIKTTAIKLSGTINTLALDIWFLLGSQVVNKLDSLWRSQLRSSVNTDTNHTHQLQVELTQLAVPTSLVGDYTKPGTVIDLELAVADKVYLRLDGKPWLNAKLCISGGKFVAKISPGTLPQANIPSETTRLSIDLGSIVIDSLSLAEIGQMGAFLTTQIPVANTGRMMIHDSQAASVEIGTYQGRFAVKVL
ncbi:MAG: hypothetical protein KDD56_04720 [Bdellovibrionales bacterium]|nr:hypothetical protein [Bdellovibrionales bacterium]